MSDDRAVDSGMRNFYAKIPRLTTTFEEGGVTLKLVLGFLIQRLPSEINVHLNRNSQLL